VLPVKNLGMVPGFVSLRRHRIGIGIAGATGANGCRIVSEGVQWKGVMGQGSGRDRPGDFPQCRGLGMSASSRHQKGQYR